ncbi:hypothetical protein N836_10795 [Leptolyngbya sp. Heron Island J]|uniref:hypothetical protein n=1 Tax=Leptolyngbya sp. Heron Island J TaxID=1385935 RepID=UPI0003B9AA38|nr:hypothetical protein [Leptolyngbya sp. Heron Island J]ESA35655.1 hypothetical protein N836_10795 [Leptolyngbya sp. Heron Island J]
MTAPSSETNQQRLRLFRNNLLKLHKLLLEAERVRYEQVNGPIKNKGEFFQLVISDDAFSWLRPISQFIVQIDEFTSAKEQPDDPEEKAAIFLEKGRLMLKPNENSSTPLAAKYFEAIQSDPQIALMNAEITQVFRT